MDSPSPARAAALLLATALALAGCVARGSAPLRPDPPPPQSSSSIPISTGAPVVREGTVVRVVDGDTAHVVIDGTREKVRFIGIDTPESTREVEPYGKAASEYTSAALSGAQVWVETDAELRDRYGRLLAYIWLERPVSADDDEIREKMHNARLLTSGHAQIYTFPPNVRYAESFVRFQREARAGNVGLWSVPGAADPLTGKRAE